MINKSFLRESSLRIPNIMQATIVTIALAICAGAFAADDFYETKYKVNVDQVLNNDRLLTSYFNCLMEKGPCTGASSELKRIIPDALVTNCKRCSAQQRDEIVKAIKFLIEEKPDMWKALEAKYDPEGKFKAAAKKDPTLKKYNLKL